VVMVVAVKDELSVLGGVALCCRRAEVAALLRFSEALFITAGRVVVSAEVDAGSVARRLRVAIGALFGYPCGVQVIPAVGRGPGARYVVHVVADGAALARRSGLLDLRGRPVRGLPAPVVAGRVCDAAAVWRGAFLARGSLTEPGRSPALEITCPGPEAAMALVGAGRRLGIAAKTREVRGGHRVLVRDGDTIGALLTWMGAPQSQARWQQRRLARVAHRSTAHQLPPLQDANQQRLTAAAGASATRAERALHILGDRAPDHLRAAGALRLHHRHASLEELGRLAEPPLSKDAVAGRLRRLLALADSIAHDRGIPDTTAALSAQL